MIMDAVNVNNEDRQAQAAWILSRTKLEKIREDRHNTPFQEISKEKCT
jgi:hypothetical protein